MSRELLRGVLRQFQDGPDGRSVSELGDHELLARFVEAREAIAFEELVRRQGPLVLGLCLRALLGTHAAEDAFQATFLVLARKAGSIRTGAALPGWLFSVARRIALQARIRRERRRAVERPATDLPARAGSDDPLALVAEDA